MREERIATIRRRLIDIREQFLREFRKQNAEAAALGDAGAPDPGDMSLNDYLGDFLHLLSDAKREEIVRIDEALRRLDEGTYGICQQCGEPIPIERLEIQPYTPYCVECKEDLEAEARRLGGPELGKL
jgi:DnaK suppressor protein